MVLASSGRERSMNMVRRLPVLQSRDEEPRRPDWQWNLIGAGFVVTLFLPLSMIGGWVARLLVRSASSRHSIVLGALPVALSFALACGASGALVARFGNRRPQAVIGAALGTLSIWCLALVTGNLPEIRVALAALAGLLWLGLLSAWLGARLAGRAAS
jgi:cation transport ATPase